MKAIVQTWLDDKTKAIAVNYHAMGLAASGKFEKELENKIIETSTGLNAKILGVDYSYQLQNGRGATSEGKKGRLYNVILKWVEQKGIQVENKKSFAYLVARKIDKQGIKVPNQYNAGGLISKVINQEAIDDLSRQLMAYQIADIQSQVLKQWQSQG
jgi:uncharacterized protein with GYD domain